jgi:hypothetical protein
MKKILFILFFLASLTGLAQVVVDSYTEVNQYTYASADWNPYNGQSFTASISCKLTSCTFYAFNYGGGGIGNIYAQIYAHSGTYGTSSLPTGSPLATSDVVDGGSWSSNVAWRTFTFSGVNQINLTSGTYYVIVMYYAGPSTCCSHCFAMDIKTNGSASGNGCTSNNGTSWSVINNNKDFDFYVYGIIPTSISKITNVAQASVSKINGITNATVKKINGVANQ